MHLGISRGVKQVSKIVLYSVATVVEQQHIIFLLSPKKPLYFFQDRGTRAIEAGRYVEKTEFSVSQNFGQQFSVSRW